MDLSPRMGAAPTCSFTSQRAWIKSSPKPIDNLAEDEQKPQTSSQVVGLIEFFSRHWVVCAAAERRDHSELLALADLGFAEFALNAHAIKCN
jgi:hypothetical protein